VNYRLGPLPVLKAYTLTGPATFTAEPVVWVHLQCTADTMDLVHRLLGFMSEHNIYQEPYGSRSGGGVFSAAFKPEDAERIKAWLLEQGARQRIKAWLLEQGARQDRGADRGIGVCPVCDEPQFRCPSGRACKNGHGY